MLNKYYCPNCKKKQSKLRFELPTNGEEIELGNVKFSIPCPFCKNNIWINSNDFKNFIEKK